MITFEKNMMGTDYRESLYLEAIVRSTLPQIMSIYMYSTYKKSILRKYDHAKINDHNTQAWAKIPLDPNETIDMRLITDRSNRMQDFTMQYRYLVPTSNDQLLIRADYGHKDIYPHMDIEFISNHKKLLSIDIIQDGKFPSYEYAINLVLIQAEKFEVEVGAKYWISPAQIHPARVDFIKKRWAEDKVKTSLTVLSRAVNLACIVDEQSGKIINENEFENIVESQLSNVKIQEKIHGGELEVVPNITGDFQSLPFLFYYIDKPPGAEYKIVGFDHTGKEVALNGVGYVEEIKDGEHVTRNFENGEK